MVHPIHLLAAGLFIATVPLGWYQGADGYFTAPVSSPLDKTLPMLSISVEEPSNQFPSTGVLIRAKIYNNTEDTIYFYEAGNMAEDFIFEVKDSKGTVVAPSKFFEQLRNSIATMSIPPFPLKPGDSCLHIIELSKDYDLKPNETYTVRIWKNIGIDAAYKTTKKISSNELSIISK
ncbi:MAG: hypothetical protein LV481_04855 [Methylacidiphilales bacterium]|nr:hypothetical protein [Candidatus Methylacidiphilales bacterium]